jgi:hypothetical protein
VGKTTGHHWAELPTIRGQILLAVDTSPPGSGSRTQAAWPGPRCVAAAASSCRRGGPYLVPGRARVHGEPSSMAIWPSSIQRGWLAGRGRSPIVPWSGLGEHCRVNASTSRTPWSASKSIALDRRGRTHRRRDRSPTAVPRSEEISQRGTEPAAGPVELLAKGRAASGFGLGRAAQQRSQVTACVAGSDGAAHSSSMTSCQVRDRHALG